MRHVWVVEALWEGSWTALKVEYTRTQARRLAALERNWQEGVRVVKYVPEER